MVFKYILSTFSPVAQIPRNIIMGWSSSYPFFTLDIRRTTSGNTKDSPYDRIFAHHHRSWPEFIVKRFDSLSPRCLRYPIVPKPQWEPFLMFGNLTFRWLSLRSIHLNRHGSFPSEGVRIITRKRKNRTFFLPVVRIWHASSDNHAVTLRLSIVF